MPILEDVVSRSKNKYNATVSYEVEEENYYTIFT